MRYYIIVPVGSLSYSILNKTTSRSEGQARKNVSKSHACLELLPTTDFSQLAYRIYSEVEISIELSSPDWTQGDDSPPQVAMLARFFKKMIS